MHTHTSCCGCPIHHMDRRTFLASVGAGTAGSALFAAAAEKEAAAPPIPRARPSLTKLPLMVQPVLVFDLPQPREQTSWRSWGGVQTPEAVAEEMQRIQAELETLGKQAEFPLVLKPLEKAGSVEQAEALAAADADVMLIYGAGGGLRTLEALIRPDRHNLLFVRHRTGPAYLWYEIAHPRLLRKTVDEYGQLGLTPADVVVDETDDLLWRMRALYALKNSVGSKILAIGGASGWGQGGQDAPAIAQEKWKLDILPYSYDDLGRRIVAARSDQTRVRAAEEDTDNYLKQSGVKVLTQRGFIERAFLLTGIIEDLMAEAGAQAMTINNCMTTIMPLAETTACLSLTILNDSGAMAFCESDFVVIPSGILLHHIASLPVFLQDPTYPHHGVVTLAHCTAPRKMDGEHLEPVSIETHFESDYGAAPRVIMRTGQTVTVIDPDFRCERWLGFRGEIAGNPDLDICRSQIDVSIDGDCAVAAQEMRGFHWMLAYGDHLRETGYALGKLGIDWLNLSEKRPVQT